MPFSHWDLLCQSSLAGVQLWLTWALFYEPGLAILRTSYLGTELLVFFASDGF